jgi:hypothetical protein
MIPITYPQPKFRTKNENGVDFIFDEIRKQWIVMSEEEWVRQNFVQYLIQACKYPAAFIAVEKEIMLGELKKRFDILVYDRQHKPWMLVECKSPDNILNAETLQQVLRYNISVPVSYLIITNGHYSFGWEKSGTALNELQQLPLLQ